MTGTQNHEGIAGTLAAIDYLAGLTGEAGSRRVGLDAAFAAIGRYETELAVELQAGFDRLPQFRSWGITDPARFDERVPTFSISHRTLPSIEVARRLAAAGVYVWHGNFYALPLTEALGVEPQGLVRIGLLHYNTREEVNYLLDVLKTID
jgi:selenocysteine lyase/cysteine desulfurase